MSPERTGRLEVVALVCALLATCNGLSEDGRSALGVTP